MKAYEAFNSWATLNTVVLLRWGADPTPSTESGQLQGWFASQARADLYDRSADASANRFTRPDGDQAGSLGGADLALSGVDRQVQGQRIDRSVVHCSHLLSFGFVVGVFLDVLVEGSARVFHEHVVERCVGRRPRRFCGDQTGRAVLGDGSAAVEDRDPATQSFRFVEVLCRQDDRRVVRCPELLDERLDVELRARIETGRRLVE